MFYVLFLPYDDVLCLLTIMCVPLHDKQHVPSGIDMVGWCCVQISTFDPAIHISM